ncbi:uncharacterized protein LOC120658349 [Panicum virgatum]|uniref:uncharacterized protein LOC120658349 n=1 Tax=Panicum virgatum TaxID=38727 RepID=UPI0019D6500F|nr:uncharacterized protein LOC120658349 [Panicum virgatum]
MAVDLSSAVGWWEEWQLRILVLGSLFLQLVLFAGSMVRNLRIPMSRLCIWLAYLGADALAIYALATLFNRHKLPPGAGVSSSALEVLWAPVLLIHLGGQHTITAYSIEDNELWRRHIVTVVSQVTVALYVFCKSWPRGGDKRLLQAAILLFVVGILKLIRKPWTLKSASLEGVMTSSVVYPERRGAQVSIWDICNVLCLRGITASDSAGHAAEMKQEEEHDLSLEDYVQKARKLKQVTEEQKVNTFQGTERLFVDLSAPYSRRVRWLNSYLQLHHKNAYKNVTGELRLAFVLIYTNFKWVLGLPGMLLHLLLPFLALASIVLFAKRHHKGYHYKESDVKVTAVLFCCTTLLEFLSLFLSPCVAGAIISSNTVAQHNLMSFYARRSRPTHLMKFSALMCCSGYINKHWYIEQAPEPACIEITQLVAKHVKDGWKQ